VNFVKSRLYYKLALGLLIGSGVLACTYAAYDADVSHVWGTLLVGVGLGKRNSVAPAVKETIVAAGNELSVAGDTRTIREISQEELEQRLAWAAIHLKDGWVSFAGQTLESVVTEFNQHNARQLVIGDEGTRHLLVGGKFRVTDVDGFLAALAVTNGVKAIVVSRQPDGQSQVIELSGGTPGSGDPRMAQ
jgi:transmembrane sensor